MSTSGWQEERRSAYLYRILAEVEQATPRGGLFREMAGEADKQADIWARDIETKGGRVPDRAVLRGAPAGDEGEGEEAEAHVPSVASSEASRLLPSGDRGYATGT